MIETLSLRNFKVLREVDVRLRPLTLVVGPNASGKSTLLEALAGISECLSRGIPAVLLFPEGRFKSFIAEGDLEVQCSGQYFGLDFVMRHNSRFVDLEGEVGLSVVMSLEPKRMAEPSLLRETNHMLPQNGEGLSTILADLYLEYPSRYQDLMARLKEVIPAVQDLRVRRTPNGFELVFDMLGAKDIRASAVSEGTLLTLGLLTLLVQPNPPQLVLIDDLERGLHPRAMGNLIKQFRLLQQQNPELQIVATTHSPYLLDYVEASEVLLTSLAEDGYAAVKPLTEHPDYERWKDLMAPGEFWSTVGERWVTEQPHK